MFLMRLINKFRNDKSLMILMFLGIYSFSTGLFSNYQVLWLQDNGLSTISISRVIMIAYIVTAFSLLFFSLKVPPKKLKFGILIACITKMVISTLLICLNGSNLQFWIKFLMFFNIAFGEIILSSIYPLMLNIKKSDVAYTKRESVESVADKLGLFFASFLLGVTIGKFTIDYNICLLFSVIFLFIAFLVLMFVDVEGKGTKNVTLRESLTYFNNNKILYLYLFVIFIGSAAWASILGLKMLSLTETIGLSSKFSSYLVLGLGILTNILAILIVKYLKFKNDYTNIFFKYGLRCVFYVTLFITNSNTVLLVTIIYLLLTDVTYSFVFSGYFMNNMDERYILVFSVFKYCITLIGDGLGTFICGLVFNLDVRYMGLTAAILGIATYMSANILVSKKKKRALNG